jgi:hypothetical protein
LFAIYSVLPSDYVPRGWFECRAYYKVE